VVCKSKKEGDLGLIDIDLMNTSLLAKWLIKLKDASLEGKWKLIIQAKYKNYVINSKTSPFGKLF
jgi:hypothetical protein